MPVPLRVRHGQARHRRRPSVHRRHSAREEIQVEADDLAAFLAELNGLEEAVRESSFEEELKLFLYSQIDILRRAAREYAIPGDRAFREAAYRVVILWHEKAEGGRRNGTEPVKWWHRLWNQTVRWGSSAEKAEKVEVLADHLDKLG
jgi:hypothetical protein